MKRGEPHLHETLIYGYWHTTRCIYLAQHELKSKIKNPIVVMLLDRPWRGALISMHTLRANAPHEEEVIFERFHMNLQEFRYVCKSRVVEVSCTCMRPQVMWGCHDRHECNDNK